MFAPSTPGAAGALTTQQQPGGLFPQMQQQMQQHPSSLDPTREVQEIVNAYNPNHPDYRFRAYFYNVVKDPRMRVKPQNVSERKWRELLDAVGGENNPDCLWPVQYDGFEGLIQRKTQAETEIKAQEEYIQAAATAVRQILQWADTELEKRTRDIKNKNMEQQHRLIKIFRALHQAQLKNYADANGGAVPPMSAEEIELLNDFKALSSRVNRSAASLPRRAEALAAASRLRHTVAPADEIQLSEDEEAKITAIVERQRARLDELHRAVDEKRASLAAAREARVDVADVSRPRDRRASASPSSVASLTRAPASSLFASPSLRRR